MLIKIENDNIKPKDSTYLDIQMVRSHIFRNWYVSPHAHHMIVVSGLHLYVSSSHSFRNTDADMIYFLQVRRRRRKSQQKQKLKDEEGKQ